LILLFQVFWESVCWDGLRNGAEMMARCIDPGFW
jgi:hypothetical protein